VGLTYNSVMYCKSSLISICELKFMFYTVYVMLFIHRMNSMRRPKMRSWMR